mmetsp:Transcript_7941/g.28974  ORF Transcript_7941/g.28974 Transcript_7941/m.28974 type:complete len:237 (-) Transcript_7941:34-744(-)
MRVLLHAFALVAAAVPGGAQVTLTSCDPLGIDESGCPGPTCRCPAWWPNLVWDEYKYCRYGNPGDVCPGPFIAPALNYLTQQGYSVQTWPRIATAAGAVLQLTCGRAGLCAAGVSTGYVGLSCTPNENGSHAASVGNTVAAVAMQTRSGNPQEGFQCWLRHECASHRHGRHVERWCEVPPLRRLGRFLHRLHVRRHRLGHRIGLGRVTRRDGRGGRRDHRIRHLPEALLTLRPHPM